MNTIAIISIGKDLDGNPYYNQCIDQIKTIIDKLNYDVRVLTDTPEVFQTIGCITYPYDKKIFSYFDKLFFSIKLAKELNKPITYVDSDNLWLLTETDAYYNLRNEKIVWFLDNWNTWMRGPLEPWKYLTDLNIEKWTEPLIEYLKIEGYDASKLETMFERLLYFPTDVDYDKLQYELEKIKPIFEYMSMYDRDLNNRLIYGHGEGLALSYALDVCGIKKEILK